MIWFDAAHRAVHYPLDRRFRVWIRRSFLIAASVVAVLPVLAAWIEFLLAGLPYIPPVPQIYPNNFAGPNGFPMWVHKKLVNVEKVPLAGNADGMPVARSDDHGKDIASVILRHAGPVRRDVDRGIPT